MSAQKLDAVTDAAPIARVDKDLSKAIMQARTAKGLSQKDLATSINAKPQVIAEYENGKAIPDGRIIAMLERKLQTVLPRPGKSKPPPKDPTARTSGTTQAKTQQGTNGGVTRGGPPKRR
jgi:putative transcription factor